jgi:hypothetical protein
MKIFLNVIGLYLCRHPKHLNMPVQELHVENLQIIRSVQNCIYEIRGERVMFDFDLANLYNVETRVLNQAVKRNIKRFPEDFMFRLTADEWHKLRPGTLTKENVPLEAQTANNGLRSQIVIFESVKGKSTKYLPYAFKEQGVAMLSGILNSDKAISMNIAIMRAFVEIRKIMLTKEDVWEQLRQLQQRLGEHDTQLSAIYDAIENLLDDKAAERKWDERTRIGFVK